MSPTVFVLLVAAAVLVVVAVAVMRSRRANDGVDSFRRQIDALSPEARRPVVDQVQNAARPADDDADVDDPDDEDGRRGT